MKTRHLAILAAVTAAVVIVAGLVVVWRESGTRRTVTEAELFPGLIDRINDVTAIEVTAGAETFRIARAGEQWVVPAKADFPARFDMVRKTLIAIGEMKSVEPKTGDPERYADLGLAEPAADEEGAGRRVRLLGAEDAELADLVVGKAAAGGAHDMVYVRRAGEDQSWLARPQLDPGKTPMDWIDTLVVQVPFERLAGGVIRHADGEVVEFAKDGPEAKDFAIADMPEGAEVTSPMTVDSLGRAISVLRFDDLAARDAAPVTGEPDAVASYRTFGGLTIGVETWVETSSGADPDAEDTYWVQIAAAYDPAAAVSEPEPEPAAAEGEEEAPFDPAAAAERINARTAQWAFKVPAFKGEQFTMRRDALIKMPEPEPEPATAEGGGEAGGEGVAPPPETGAGAGAMPPEEEGAPAAR
jgi:hypothetical protein